MLHIPDWFPGSGLKREAREATKLRDRAVETAYQYVRNRMVSFWCPKTQLDGDNELLLQESKDHINDGMVSDHITRMEKLDPSYRTEYELALKHASVTAFIGEIF